MSHLVLLWGAQWFDKNPFPYNKDIIRKEDDYSEFSKGYVYWGKFFREYDKDGGSTMLEPLGEAYGKPGGQHLCDELNEQINKGKSPVYLYLINQWFFDQPLTIAQVKRAFYTPEGLPPADDDGRPACAHIPHYYFHPKRKEAQCGDHHLYEKPLADCHACRSTQDRCKLRFSCNFWFQVTGFYPVPQVRIRQVLYNLVYGDNVIGELGKPFDPTGAALYPIRVEQKVSVDFFLEASPKEQLPHHRQLSRTPAALRDVARKKLEYLRDARHLKDLRVLPGLRLEALKGDRKGQHSIRINKQWRICFVWWEGTAYEIEICDYH